MWVEPQELGKKGQESPLPRGRVADVEAHLTQGEEEAVEGGPDLEAGMAKRGDRQEPGGPRIDGAEVVAEEMGAGDDGEGGLVAVVREEEVSSGCEAAPGTVDSMTADE